MPEPLTVGYFLEDYAQRDFITSLVERVARDLGIEVAHDVRNATGGKGRAVSELRSYLRDARGGRVQEQPILVVAIDGNCTSFQARRKEIEQTGEQTGYRGTLVCAVPDPHIERWYLADAEGFKSAIEGSRPPELPAHKCERGLYKQALRDAFRDADIIPQLGGAEYAREIVSQMDFFRAGKEDAALKHFLDELRMALQPFSRTDN